MVEGSSPVPAPQPRFCMLNTSVGYSDPHPPTFTKFRDVSNVCACANASTLFFWCRSKYFVKQWACDLEERASVAHHCATQCSHCP
jgi:hypothetical protein